MLRNVLIRSYRQTKKNHQHPVDSLDHCGRLIFFFFVSRYICHRSSRNNSRLRFVTTSWMNLYSWLASDERTSWKFREQNTTRRSTAILECDAVIRDAAKNVALHHEWHDSYSIVYYTSTISRKALSDAWQCQGTLATIQESCRIRCSTFFCHFTKAMNKISHE